jgi:tetratricopeptide (TPR) repeat protein/predicted Ser/Thr protein kinase
MNALIEELFHRVVDLPPHERLKYLLAHGIDDDTRREVEALLAFEMDASAVLDRNVGSAAARALPGLDPIGSRCGPYRLLKVIGRGGMGAVYLAERVDGEVSQRVAVKLLPPGAAESYRERFLQERQILATVTHPNIARMLDAGHLDYGQPFLAMEYVEGRPIDEHAAHLTLRDTLSLFLEVCAAVAYLHRHVIVHRDLKPTNILVTAEGEPKLLDFGIAKLLDASTDATTTGTRSLTPAYASPEQFLGEKLSTATDVYSLGALLYRLLTGRTTHDFTGLSAEAALLVVTGGEIAAPSHWRPELKGDLESILLKALRRDPQDRYGTVEQFADDVRRFLANEPIAARPDSLAYRARKFARRHRAGIGAAAAVTLALVAGTGIAVRQARDSARQRDVALGELRRAEASNEFTSFLLAAATPAAGKPISNADLLARGEALIAKRFAAEPALRIHMLLTLADRYAENQQFADRTRVLDRAFAESRSVADEGLRAEVACQRASQFAESGDAAQAFGLLDDALRLLSAHPEYASIEAGCRVTESIAASKQMDPAHAIRAAERALALAQARGGIPVIESDALAALAAGYKNAYRYDEANRIYERMMRLSESQGLENTRDTTIVLNNWGVMHGDAGQMLSAGAVAERAVRLARSLDSEHGASLTLLTNYAGDLAPAGHVAEANEVFDEALDKARAAGSPARRIATLSLAIGAAVEAEDAPRAARLLAESHATLQAFAAASQYHKGVVVMDDAEVALVRGEGSKAVTLARQALANLETATPNQAGAAAAEQTLAHALNTIGRFDEALPIAERRASTARNLLGGYRFSYRLGKALLEVALAHAGLGNRAAARDAVASAIEHISATAGPQSKALRRALTLRQELNAE